MVLEVNPASMALLDLLARFMRKKDQYVLARLRAVLVTDNLNAAEETLREDILQYAQKAKIEVEPLLALHQPQEPPEDGTLPCKLLAHTCKKRGKARRRCDDFRACRRSAL